MLAEVISTTTDISLGHETETRVIPFGRVSGNLELPKYNKTNILFLHENIAGLKVGTNDYMLASPIKKELLSDWDFVFNGHIHKPQTMGNVINIGSPMIQDWSEADDKKRFIHYKDGEVISVPIECPRFIHFDKLTDKVRNKIEKNNRDYFRVDVDSSFVGDPIFSKYNCFYNIIKSKKREIRLKQTDNIENELVEYIKIKNPKLDHDKLLKIGKELANESSS
jgi:hypothetical protein